jgi:polysaccharide biosynthesis/export protein
MRIQFTRNSCVPAVLLIFVGLGWGQNQQNTPQEDNPPQQAKLASDKDISTSPTAPSTYKPADDFVIGNEDVLAISVWKEPEISRAVPVRSDGKISLPLIGELQATGKTAKQLQVEIATGLQAYMSEPEVTVIVQEIKSQKFNILGHVQRPGSYLLTPPMTVMDAIAAAGGFRDFAKVKSVYVLRPQADGSPTRIPFNYKQVIRGAHSEQNVELEPRDTIVVP